MNHAVPILVSIALTLTASPAARATEAVPWAARGVRGGLRGQCDARERPVREPAVGLHA